MEKFARTSILLSQLVDLLVQSHEHEAVLLLQELDVLLELNDSFCVRVLLVAVGPLLARTTAGRLARRFGIIVAVAVAAAVAGVVVCSCTGPSAAGRRSCCRYC